MSMQVTESTTPDEFFEKILPELASAKQGELSDEQKAVSHAVGVVLSGDGGGSWTLKIDGGQLQVSKGVAEESNPVVELSVEDWRGVMTGKKAMLASGPSADLMAIDPSKFKPVLLERIKPINGTIRFVVEDPDEGDLQVTIKFGGSAPDEPQTTVTTDAETARQTQEGTMNPQMAFMQGKVRIVGDMNLAMQVGSLAMIQ